MIFTIHSTENKLSHMLQAMIHRPHVVIGQKKVPRENEKDQKQEKVEKNIVPGNSK